MALIEIDNVNGKTVGRVTVPSGPRFKEMLGMLFDACDNAACECTDLTISLITFSKDPTRIADFTVDALSKQRSKYDFDNSNADLIDSLIREFDGEDWKSLWIVFKNLKLDTTENIDFISTLAEFPMSIEIETDGLLVSYSSILPHGRKFILGDEDGECILLDDQYCLMSGCDCDQMAISFIQIKDRVQIEGEPPIFSFCYRSGEISNVDEGDSIKEPSAQIWKRFLEKYPDLIEAFSKRHKQLEKLYENYLARKHQSLIEESLDIPLKVGRNDPCPCGSGKKYKKCCL